MFVSMSLGFLQLSLNTSRSISNSKLANGVNRAVLKSDFCSMISPNSENNLLL